jgi:hypothetical protein
VRVKERSIPVLTNNKQVAAGVHPSFAPTGEVIELNYERCLVLVRLDADIPPAMKIKQRVALQAEATAHGVVKRQIADLIADVEHALRRFDVDGIGPVETRLAELKQHLLGVDAAPKTVDQAQQARNGGTNP